MTVTNQQLFNLDGNQTLTSKDQYLTALSEILKVYVSQPRAVIEAGEKLETIVFKAVKEN